HEEDIYRANVQQAVDEINARKYQKVILSRRIPLPAGVDILQTYRAGRARNTPARSFLVQLGGSRMAGFSPETVVEVTSDGWVSTQPL
ncbi:chorismate-binding protein, partial [Pseudomonas aeruginosa]